MKGVMKELPSERFRNWLRQGFMVQQTTARISDLAENFAWPVYDESLFDPPHGEKEDEEKGGVGGELGSLGLYSCQYSINTPEEKTSFGIDYRTENQDETMEKSKQR